MTGGLLIAFREGLEAFLVVGIIISYLARVNLQRYNKWVFAGVGLGIATEFVCIRFAKSPLVIKSPASANAIHCQDYPRHFSI